jgi:cell division septation protein DedD
MTVYKDDMSSFATGEQFMIVTHGDLPGSSCSLSQATADGQGRIKGSCHSEGTGRFVFEVNSASKQQVQGGSTWEVYFVGGSSNGYPSQGTQNSDKMEAVILQSPATAELHTNFTIEVKAKKDGQILNDTNLIQSVRWTVLKGSMVVAPGSPSSAGNRQLTIFTDDKDTVLTADVTFSSGEQVKTASKTIKFLVPATAQPVASPKVSPTPKASPKSTTANTTQENPNPTEFSPTPTPSPSATPAPAAPATPQPWWRRLINWLMFWKR